MRCLASVAVLLATATTTKAASAAVVTTSVAGKRHGLHERPVLLREGVDGQRRAGELFCSRPNYELRHFSKGGQCTFFCLKAHIAL